MVKNHMITILIAFISLALLSPANGQGLNLSLSTGTSLSHDDSYHFKKENEESVKKLLLFGLIDEPVTPPASGRFNYGDDFEQFIRHHLKSATEGLVGDADTHGIDVVTGEESFISNTLNKGNSVKRAKLAGFSMDIGSLKLGGGYTWNEENPALLRDETKGLILGVAYGNEKWGLQTSVLSSGASVSGIRTGGDRYDSVMVGASWKASDKHGYAATVQYQNEGQHDGATLFTVGSKIKF